jgi:hypothetical protein
MPDPALANPMLKAGRALIGPTCFTLAGYGRSLESAARDAAEAMQAIGPVMRSDLKEWREMRERFDKL